LPIEPSLLLLAVFFTFIIAVGLFSSWEYAAVLAAIISVVPLVVATKEYLAFLKTPLFDADIFKVTNFSAILIFDSIIIAYAFNAWVRTLFLAAFIALIAYYCGILTPEAIPKIIGGP